MHLTSLHLKSLPAEMLAALGLVNKLTAAGYESYLVGGCVRDLVLAHVEPHDYDISTAATPTQILEVFPEAAEVGAHFGVCLVASEYGPVQIATFRTDRSNPDSPEEPLYTTDLIEDLRHRDFTLNTLVINAGGEVFDYLYGARAFGHRLLATPGLPEARIIEDPIRLLRAARFAARFGLGLEAALAVNMRQLAATIHRVTPERVASELTKILTGGQAATAFDILERTGVLRQVLPEVALMRTCPQNPKWHPEGDTLTHTFLLLKQLRAGCSPTLAWAALLHDTGKPAVLAFDTEGVPVAHGHEEHSARIADDVLRALKLPNGTVETVVSHCAQHMKFRAAQNMRRSKLLRFVRQAHFRELLELHRLDANAGRGNLENAEFIERVLEETPAEVLKPERLVTGHDLKDLGLQPGPVYKDALEAVENMQLEGVFSTRAEALAFLRFCLASKTEGEGLTRGDFHAA